MSELRDKVLESTGKDLGPMEELKLVDLGSLKTLLSNSNLVSANEMYANKKRQTEGAGEDPCLLDSSNELNSEFITNMGKKLQEIPELYKQTCQLLMTKTNATCDWLKNIKANQKVDLEEEELKQQLEQHINEGKHPFYYLLEYCSFKYITILLY
ncbi:hypothetical protein C0J52_09666 [Blattella germanica]|nr:hypothetical protein C0J52_09666 [Blattella germanica]